MTSRKDGKMKIAISVVAAALLLVLFRSETAGVEVKERTVVTDYMPSVLMAGTVVLLIVASVIPNTPPMINGIICMSLMVIGILYDVIRKRSLKAAAAASKEHAPAVIFPLLLYLDKLIAEFPDAGNKIPAYFRSSSGSSFYVLTNPASHFGAAAILNEQEKLRALFAKGKQATKNCFLLHTCL